MLEFLGRIVGKALYEGILLEYSFSPLFISKLLGRYSFLDELSSLDAELHRNLVYLKHYGGDARDLALDFTVTEELFGKHYTVELRPGGADMVVTNENKLQYVHAMADYKLNRQMRPLVTAFARGMADIVDPQWLGLFNAKEFNQHSCCQVVTMILTWMTYAFTLVTLVATLRVVELLSYSGRWSESLQKRKDVPF